MIGPKRKVTKEKGPSEGIAAIGNPMFLATARQRSGFLCRFEFRFEAIDKNCALAKIRKSHVMADAANQN